MRRSTWLAPLALAALLGALYAGRPAGPAHAQRDMREVVARPPAVLVAHEWGVWRLEDGRVTHLADLAAESPPFVVRADATSPGGAVVDGPLQPAPIAPVGPGHAVARKPILFFHADRAVDVRVTVGFRGGRPWLHFPAAAPDAGPQGASLAWVGRVDPAIARATFPAVEASHWWSDLRDVGATPFVSSLDGRAEGFLFYDGPVAFEPVFHVDPATDAVVPQSTERDAWVVRGETVTHVELLGRSGERRTRGGVAAFRAELAEALRARGLTVPEAASLVSTWRDELFAREPHAVYFVPREAYDRMLPIRIEPVPTELVRVGLVIEPLR